MQQPRSNGRELPAAALATASAAFLLILIYVGSRGLRDFDAALIGYAVGTVFAVAGLVYRYTLWITRPPTWRYFRAGWRDFLSWRNFRRYTTLIPVAWWTDILAQTFIFRRSALRWAMHMAIFWGVILSLAITLPLTFGWFRFTLSGDDHYRIWFFGFELFRFPLHTAISFLIFHALDFTAALLLVGLAIALWRRTTDAGFLTSQRFGFDLIPLVLRFAIAVTGLTLTASELLWEGRYYSFVSVTHEVIVVGWLLSLPFGKFFHIIERPATIGVTLYQTVNEDVERAGGTGVCCRRCEQPLPSKQFVLDLKATLDELGQRYDMEECGSLQDYCPTCKRVLRGQAYYRLMETRFL
jgi:hypothetical protein